MLTDEQAAHPNKLPGEKIEWTWLDKGQTFDSGY
jgi:hypothetical protein